MITNTETRLDYIFLVCKKTRVFNLENVIGT